MWRWLPLVGRYGLAAGAVLAWYALGWPRPLAPAVAALAWFVWTAYSPSSSGAVSPALAAVNARLELNEAEHSAALEAHSELVADGDAAADVAAGAAVPADHPPPDLTTPGPVTPPWPPAS